MTVTLQARTIVRNRDEFLKFRIFKNRDEYFFYYKNRKVQILFYCGSAEKDKCYEHLKISS